MDTTKLRHELTTLDQVLIELENDERNYADIVKNLQCAVRMDLEYVTRNESIGRDDYSDVAFTIMSTRERIRFLEEHPEFDGNLIDLRKAIGERPSQGAIEAARDTEPESQRDTWPEDSSPMFIGSPVILPPDFE